MIATRLNLKSLPEAPNNWWQVNPNGNDYHSDHMESSNTIWSAGITDWWC